jgi:hypothetical protein
MPHHAFYDHPDDVAFTIYGLHAGLPALAPQLLDKARSVLVTGNDAAPMRLVFWASPDPYVRETPLATVERDANGNLRIVAPSSLYPGAPKAPV